MIEKTLGEIREALAADLQHVQNAKDIEALKVKYLGKKGSISGLMLLLKDVSAEERPHLGKEINLLKESVTHRLDEELDRLEDLELKKRLGSETIDITLPGRQNHLARRHLVLKMLSEAISILEGMGFSVQLGPEIESDYYNFEALNFSKDHPARDMQDTYYITPEILLRTHTSNTQIRVMENNVPPIRIIAPGKCYRNEDVSARSHVVFHQIEGVYIDKNVTFADLLVTLKEFFSKLFNKEVKTRNRPSYFPFVEPGLEVDVECIHCAGKGCFTCKHTGWLEVAGSGMIHPEVLRSGGIDPEVFSGYAWGFGIERLAMLRYGVPDIRLFLENDLRMLEQF